MAHDTNDNSNNNKQRQEEEQRQNGDVPKTPAEVRASWGSEGAAKLTGKGLPWVCRSCQVVASLLSVVMLIWLLPHHYVLTEICFFLPRLVVFFPRSCHC